jgi:hypothetical protein
MAPTRVEADSKVANGKNGKREPGAGFAAVADEQMQVYRDLQSQLIENERELSRTQEMIQQKRLTRGLTRGKRGNGGTGLSKYPAAEEYVPQAATAATAATGLISLASTPMPGSSTTSGSVRGAGAASRATGSAHTHTHRGSALKPFRTGVNAGTGGAGTNLTEDLGRKPSFHSVNSSGAYGHTAGHVNGHANGHVNGHANGVGHSHSLGRMSYGTNYMTPTISSKSQGR